MVDFAIEDNNKAAYVKAQKSRSHNCAAADKYKAHP